MGARARQAVRKTEAELTRKDPLPAPPCASIQATGQGQTQAHQLRLSRRLCSGEYEEGLVGEVEESTRHGITRLCCRNAAPD